MSLVAELQRRRVFRALVGYGIAAFAVLQIVEPIMHGLHWSEAVLSYVVVALAAGFPIVVSLAWILTRPVVFPASYQIAQVYAWRGEADHAFEWLGHAVEHRDAGLSYLKYDPFLRNLRGDPRYAALLKKMDLPPDWTPAEAASTWTRAHNLHLARRPARLASCLGEGAERAANSGRWFCATGDIDENRHVAASSREPSAPRSILCSSTIGSGCATFPGTSVEHLQPWLLVHAGHDDVDREMGHTINMGVGHIYQWGPLMVGPLLSSLPMVVVYFLRRALRGRHVGSARG